VLHRPLEPKLTGSPNGRDEAIPSTPGLPRNSGMRIRVGGCAGEAARALGEGDLFGDATTLADQITVSAFSRAEADPRVVAVFGAWSTCMIRRGYRFASPFAAAGSVDIHTKAPSKTEIATAVADVACKKATKLVDVFYAVEVTRERDLIRKYIRHLNRLKGQIARVAETAAAVLGVDVPQ
jgi:hypothetical protein